MCLLPAEFDHTIPPSTAESTVLSGLLLKCDVPSPGPVHPRLTEWLITSTSLLNHPIHRIHQVPKSYGACNIVVASGASVEQRFGYSSAMHIAILTV